MSLCDAWFLLQSNHLGLCQKLAIICKVYVTIKSAKIIVNV